MKNVLNVLVLVMSSSKSLDFDIVDSKFCIDVEERLTHTRSDIIKSFLPY